MKDIISTNTLTDSLLQKLTMKDQNVNNLGYILLSTVNSKSSNQNYPTISQRQSVTEQLSSSLYLIDFFLLSPELWSLLQGLQLFQ